MAKAKEDKTPAAGNNSGMTRSNHMVLIAAVLDMSWRLALAVLVPIIGGFELDKHLGISPALTVVGFLIAMAGTFLVLKRAVTTADDRFRPRETH